ncbi:MAG: polymerase subunit sigma-24 [Akkermansiaceae bacterium]|nr:polymerase subunit sigma-24 [Akkermansiaceae bacterium]
MTEVAAILEELNRGEGVASERLLPLVYEELRRLAASRMQRESGSQTLQPTALVHEAWLRLVGNGDPSWQNQAHFFGAAARAMRRILVDRSRSKAAMKRQSRENVPDLDNEATVEADDHILMIHESLKRLEKEDPAAANVVLLKFYSGLSSEEIARMSQCSVRSVERQWTLAKARLYQMIQEDQGNPQRP